jgi:hypothetical protein
MSKFDLLLCPWASGHNSNLCRHLCLLRLWASEDNWKESHFSVCQSARQNLISERRQHPPASAVCLIASPSPATFHQIRNSMIHCHWDAFYEMRRRMGCAPGPQNKQAPPPTWLRVPIDVTQWPVTRGAASDARARPPLASGESCLPLA